MLNAVILSLCGLRRLACCCLTGAVLVGCAPLDPTLGIEASSIAATDRDPTNGQVSAVGRTLDSARQAGSNDPRVVLGLAETQLAKGNHRHAKQLLKRLSQHSAGPETGRFYQAHGIIALRLGEPERAQPLLERSVDADPSLWRAWIGLGRVHLQAGRPQEALSTFIMAEQTAPQIASAQNDIGMAHLKLENPEVAIEHFKRALEIEPAHALARANLRIAKAMHGDYRGAIDGIKLDQQHDAFNNVGYAALLRGEYELADRYLKRAVETGPTPNGKAVANLALIPK